MKAKLKLIILFMVAATMAAAQGTQSTLTNATVTKLVKCGLDNGIIITTIDAASGKYDITPDGLASLKASGVPANVISAITAKMQGNKVVKAPVGATPQANSNLIQTPEIINAIYLHDKNANGLKLLEKADAAQKTHKAGLGFVNHRASAYCFSVLWPISLR